MKNLARLFLYLFIIASAVPALGQTVTFKTYPADAEVHVGSGTPDGMTPLGRANQPIDLSERYSQSVLKIIITADGRKPWKQTFTSGELASGEYDVYLHPTNPLMYPIDLFNLYPLAALAICGIILFAVIYIGKEWKSKQEGLRGEEAFKALGANMRRQFGHYIAFKELGRGGMGVVFLAVPEGDISEDAIVAIKVLDKGVAETDMGEPEDSTGEATETDKGRFRREIKILKDLRHPNILNVIDWGLDDDEQFLVTELLKGQELEDYLQAHAPLSLEEVAEKFEQMASAIQYVHDAGVLHRDLKPQNIFLTESNKIKVLDFGLASSKHQSRVLTQPGVPMGTLNFMSPECFMGLPLDKSADQFALGVILFQMFTGKLPIEAELVGGGGIKNYNEMATAERPSLKESRPDIPDSVADVVAKMLATDARQRFRSVDEALKAFHAAVGR